MAAPTREECMRRYTNLEDALRRENPLGASLHRFDLAVLAAIRREMGEIELDYFLHTACPKLVLTLLKRANLDEARSLNVCNVFRNVLSLAIMCIPLDILEMLDTINRLFAEPTYAFYTQSVHYDMEIDLTQDDEDEEDEEGGGSDIIYAQATLSTSSWEVSDYFIYLVNHFGRRDGFNQIIRRIEDTRTHRPPAAILLRHVRIFSKVYDVMPQVLFRGYVAQLRDRVFDVMLDYTDEEFKDENIRTIQDVNRVMHSLFRTVDFTEGGEHCERFSLAISHKFFRSPILKKRIAGLSEVKEMVLAAERREFFDTRQQAQGTGVATYVCTWLDVRVMVEWLEEKKIFASLFGENLHTELLKRSVDIVKFLARERRLDNQKLDFMWEATKGNHESVTQCIYTIISQLPQHLPVESVDYLYEKIRSVQPEDWDNHWLLLVRNFTSNFMLQGSNQSPNLYGLQLLWDLIQDDSQAVGPTRASALQYLGDLLAWTSTQPHRMVMMEYCVENLRQHRSIGQSLLFLQKILSTFSTKVKRAGEPTLAEAIGRLETQSHLLDLVMENVRYYKDTATDVLNTLSPDDRNSCVLVGRYAHLPTVHAFTTFLTDILKQGSQSMNDEQVNILWDCFVARAFTREEGDKCFLWLETTRSHSTEIFPESVTNLLFGEKFSSLDVESLSHSGYQFFEYFFRYVNWKEKRFDQKTTEKNAYIVKALDLLGIDNLWRIVMETRHPLVGTQATQLLIKMYQNLCDELKHHAGEKRVECISICMKNLAEAEATFAGPGSKEELRIERVLMLLKYLLDEFDEKLANNFQGLARRHGVAARGSPMTVVCEVVHGSKFELPMYSNDSVRLLRQKVAELHPHPPENTRIITMGKELRPALDGKTLEEAKLRDRTIVYIMGKNTPATGGAEPQPLAMAAEEVVDDESTYPSVILSQQKHFDLLFQLLNLGDNIAGKAWELLMHLPTNEKMETELREVGPKFGSTRWRELVDTRYIFKLLYTLQILDSLAQNAETEGSTWCQQFVGSGGLRHLVDIFFDIDFVDPLQGSQRIQCLCLLLKIINHFTPDPSLRNTPSFKETLQRAFSADVGQPAFMERLMQVVATCAKSLPPDNSDDEAIGSVILLPAPQSEELSVVRHAMSLLVSCAFGDPTKMASILQYRDIEGWMDCVLLRSPRSLQTVIIEGLYRLASEAPDPNFVEDESVPHPHTSLLAMLLSILPSVESYSKTCGGIFDLLVRLIKDSGNGRCGGKPSDFSDLAEQVANQIKDHRITEARNSEEEDHVLIGLMELLNVLISQNPDAKRALAPSSTGSMISEVFHNCLFNIPTVLNHGPHAPPKCKTRRSRSTAFSLLVEMARDCEEGFREITGLLLEQQKGSEKRTLWSFLPSSMDKSPYGYVGLKNLGATCYMNSVIQQFYMIPQFRYGILAAPLPPDSTQEHLLWQLQKMFSHLQESEKKFYDTREFCSSYKDVDGSPMNTTLQMDVEEFLAVFIDRLEFALKGTAQEDLLGKLFGGVLVSQLIGKSCPHSSECDEPFFTLKLEIKHKKTLQESLDLFVEGDMLVGDNQYHCSKCDDKVDALKRTCIKALPNTLIVHLKRFDFDLDQMRKNKVNDLLQFPMDLNMEPYTKEGLARREKETRTVGREEDGMSESSSVMESETPEPLHPSGYYEYKLVGILVHTGTSDTGHYYSFIKERVPSETNAERKWFRFNDSIIEPFDVNDIPASCFGGQELVTQWDSIMQKQMTRWAAKSNNAYMLFYQRALQDPQILDINSIIGKPTPEPTPKDMDFSAPSECSIPFQMPELVPKPIFTLVWEENVSFMQDKNIFDLDYFWLMWEVCQVGDSPPVLENKSLEKYSPALQTIQLGTKFVMECLAHAKEKQSLKSWIDFLKLRYSRHLPACRWFLELFINKPLHTKKLLMMCTIPEARIQIAELIGYVLLCLRPTEVPFYQDEITSPSSSEMEYDTPPSDDGTKKRSVFDSETEDMRPGKQAKSTIIRFIDSHFSLLQEAASHSRHFAQYFLVMKNFAAMGVEERTYMLSREVITQLVEFYLAEDAFARKKKSKMGDRLPPPNLTYMVDTISLLTRGCTLPKPSDVGLSPVQLPPPTQQMSRMDFVSVSSMDFHTKLLKDSINVDATNDILVHLGWGDDATSRSIIDMLCTSIDQYEYELFKPFFDCMSAMLGMNDRCQHGRVAYALDSLLKVIERNLRYKMATTTALRSLATLATSNSIVRTLLFQHRFRWVDVFLLESNYELVREAAEQLVLQLVPEAGTVATYIAGRGSVYTYPQEDTLAAASIERLNQLHTYLLHLLPHATTAGHREYDELRAAVVEEDIAPSKVSGYFRLLKFACRSRAAKAAFRHEAWPAFFKIFCSIDKERRECDENKRELLNYWYHVVQDSPENLDLIACDATISQQFLDSWVCIRPTDRAQYYNSLALPPFYKIVVMCARRSEDFLCCALAHLNIQWALEQLWILHNEYMEAGSLLLDLVRLGAKLPEVSRLRTMLIQACLQGEHAFANPGNVLRLLDVVLVTTEDIATFCLGNGAEIVSQVVEQAREFDEETSELLSIVINILLRAIQWLQIPEEECSDDIARRKVQVLENWETMGVLCTILLQFRGRFTPEQRQKAFTIVCFLAERETFCMQHVLLAVEQDHCSANDMKRVFDVDKCPQPAIPASDAMDQEQAVRDEPVSPEVFGEVETFSAATHRQQTEGLSEEEERYAQHKEWYCLPYYKSVRSVCLATLAMEDDEHVHRVAKIGLALALETLESASIHSQILDILTTILSDPSRQNLVLDDPLLRVYTDRILTKGPRNLLTESCAAIMRATFATTWKETPTEQRHAWISSTEKRLEKELERTCAALETGSQEEVHSEMENLVATVQVIHTLGLSDELLPWQPMLLARAVSLLSHERSIDVPHRADALRVVHELPQPLT